MQKLNGLPVYKIFIDEQSPEYGINDMSLVFNPATDSEFYAFSANNEPNNSSIYQIEQYNFNDEKRILTGVALRSNYPILRESKEGKYYVLFDEDTILSCVKKFMREKKTDKVSINHKFECDDVYLIESFISDERHKLYYPEFNNIDSGSWIVSYKVDNDDVWNEVRSGNIKGFSVGIMAERISMDNNIQLQELYSNINKIQTYINKLN